MYIPSKMVAKYKKINQNPSPRGPRPIPDICFLPDPLPFSLFTPFKQRLASRAQLWWLKCHFLVLASFYNFFCISGHQIKKSVWDAQAAGIRTPGYLSWQPGKATVHILCLLTRAKVPSLVNIAVYPVRTQMRFSCRKIMCCKKLVHEILRSISINECCK